MKIRNGFVSNSSSASFIITFTSTLPRKEVEKYISKSSQYLEERWLKDVVEERVNFLDMMSKKENPRMEKVVYKALRRCLKRKENKYYLDEGTIMFNDWMDINTWPFIRAISEGRINGINLEEIIQTSSEMDDTHTPTIFDRYSWEGESNIQRQAEVESEYIEYLIKILGDSEELKVQLASYLLSK